LHTTKNTASSYLNKVIKSDTEREKRRDNELLGSIR